MSSDLKTIDRNRFVKKYPYVRGVKKTFFVSDGAISFPFEDGYYIDGVLAPIPNGLWQNNELLIDLNSDFLWYQNQLTEVGDMIFGLKWSPIEPGPGDQPSGYEGFLGQVAYSDGNGNVYASTTISIDDANSILSTAADIIPDEDLMFDLGAENLRFANVYTGDLHLRNDRGHWQIVEEADCLTITNRLDGRKYKFVLEPF
jgi:hypothetical protein